MVSNLDYLLPYIEYSNVSFGKSFRGSRRTSRFWLSFSAEAATVTSVRLLCPQRLGAVARLKRTGYCQAEAPSLPPCKRYSLSCSTGRSLGKGQRRRAVAQSHVSPPDLVFSSNSVWANMDDEQNGKVEEVSMTPVATREEVDSSQATSAPIANIPVHFFQTDMLMDREQPDITLVDDKPNGVEVGVTSNLSPLMTDSPLALPVLTTPEQRRNFFLGLINELIEECTIFIAFLVHRREKRNSYARAKGSIEEEALIDRPGYDVFGNRLTRGCLSRAYQLTKLQCVCPVCHLSKCALRFAPHLEKCMGLGRGSRRRAVTEMSASKTANEVCGSYGTGSDAEEQKSSGEVDEDWLPSQEKLRKRKAGAKATGRRKGAIHSSRMSKRCQKETSIAGAWDSTTAEQTPVEASMAISSVEPPPPLPTTSCNATGVESVQDVSTAPSEEWVGAGCSKYTVPPLSSFRARIVNCSWCVVPFGRRGIFVWQFFKTYDTSGGHDCFPCETATQSAIECGTLGCPRKWQFNLALPLLKLVSSTLSVAVPQ
uniref:SAGA-associated factor 11 n=1 Tax=Trichuris muris TaxID=70415 RepID=A0A5S6R035_TRIMR